MIKSFKRLILLFIIVLSVLLLLQGYLIHTGKNNPLIGTWILSSAYFQIPASFQKKSPAAFKNGIQISFTANIAKVVPIGRKLFSFSGLAFGGGFTGIYGSSEKYLYAHLQYWLDFFTKETCIQFHTVDEMIFYQDIFSRILVNSTYEIHTDTLLLVNNENKLTFVKHR